MTYEMQYKGAPTLEDFLETFNVEDGDLRYLINCAPEKLKRYLRGSVSRSVLERISQNVSEDAALEEFYRCLEREYKIIDFDSIKKLMGIKHVDS